MTTVRQPTIGFGLFHEGREPQVASAIGWARVRPKTGLRLRRGAWYPVLTDDRTKNVEIDVAEHAVAVPREQVQIRRHRPERFSVVVKSSDDPNRVKGTPEDLGLRYAVCPASHSRVRLSGHPNFLVCPDCGHRYPVAWDDEC